MTKLASLAKLLHKQPYSSGHGEHDKLLKMHENLKHIEDLFAKYRMDKFTHTSQVDDLLNRNIITKVMARHLKEEIETKQEAASI